MVLVRSIVTVICLVLSFSVSAKQVYTLKFASLIPPDTAWMKEIRSSEIERLTARRDALSANLPAGKEDKAIEALKDLAKRIGDEARKPGLSGERFKELDNLQKRLNAFIGNLEEYKELYYVNRYIYEQVLAERSESGRAPGSYPTLVNLWIFENAGEEDSLSKIISAERQGLFTAIKDKAPDALRGWESAQHTGLIRAYEEEITSLDKDIQKLKETA